MKLSSIIYYKICALWPADIDLFVSAWNAQLPTFVSWTPQPGFFSINAFSLNWADHFGYIFPPPIFFVHALLARVVSNNEASRLEIIRNSFGSRGFPTGVVDLLLAGNHSNTNTAYESAWKNWGDWCLERNANPMSPNLMSIGIPTSPENDW